MTKEYKYSSDELTAEEIAEFDLIPYNDRIVVKELKVDKVGLLYMPGTAEEEMRTNEGFVIATGSGATFVAIGDRVYYGRYSGVWIPRMGTQKVYRLMNEEDLLGRVKVAEEGDY